MSDIWNLRDNFNKYNQDGCPADQIFADQISDTAGCHPISGTGITNVVVVPKPDMPSTCTLTLYSDTNCFTTSKTVLGPITRIEEFDVGSVRRKVAGGDDRLLLVLCFFHCIFDSSLLYYLYYIILAFYVSW